MGNPLAALYAWVVDDGEHECIVSGGRPDGADTSVTPGIPPWALVGDNLPAVESAREYIQAMATHYDLPFRLVVFGARVTLETVEPAPEEPEDAL